eukprot:TRINITY_DN6399_c0_g1_i2.p1 TRINITY_DN6399_c0_g1~~TRINITY_DN6399_c0_g1_i2.p1  ORF type:complete len:425 (+),score=83.98 TRINITY_DN6399_c0_g1_i2:389-1663(+)
MMIARALELNDNALLFFSTDKTVAYQKVLEILQNKITTYEAWDSTYPGFGGYLPWVYINDTGIRPADGWDSKVPALDNGENIWALYALLVVLEESKDNCQPQYCPTINSLFNRYNAYMTKLKKNAYMMFYDGQGRIRAETTILNVHAQPYPGNYINKSPGYYLDDPYEGELFAFFLDLYGEWPNPNEREQVWINKRAKLQSVDLSTPSGPITVQRGFWFSSHEQWKYLEMPYLDVPINARVFMNGERARVANSNMNKIPGLYASVSNVTTGGPVQQYLSAGIPPIAFNQNLNDYDLSLITPYGSFPVLLANYTVGLQWYWTMLKGPRMQGPYGSTESTYITGTMISPVTTWDSKITTVTALHGGVASIVRRGLVKEGKYDRFFGIVNREWKLAFPSLSGENLPFESPKYQVPQQMNPNTFSLCQ